jgi:uncharacterized protein YfaS (alpha-2-macroglobulin family)
MAKLERRRRYLRDYGTPLRDLAATTTLMVEARLTEADPAPLLERLAVMQAESDWLSTQEQGWLLMAAKAVTDERQAMTLAVNEAVQPERTEPLILHPSLEQLNAGLRVRNAGQGNIWARATVMGAPEDQLAPVSQGFSVERKFYTLDGAEVPMTEAKQTDAFVVVISGRANTTLYHQMLVVDLLPAGFEVENARLADARSTTELSWLPQLTNTLYSEFLDDRYVAAFDLDPDTRDFTVAYLVRAVTPGTYALPATEVEDMYKPEYRARLAQGTVTIAPAAP